MKVSHDNLVSNHIDESTILEKVVLTNSIPVAMQIFPHCTPNDTIALHIHKYRLL